MRERGVRGAPGNPPWWPARPGSAVHPELSDGQTEPGVAVSYGANRAPRRPATCLGHTVHQHVRPVCSRRPRASAGRPCPRSRALQAGGGRTGPSASRSPVRPGRCPPPAGTRPAEERRAAGLPESWTRPLSRLRADVARPAAGPVPGASALLDGNTIRGPAQASRQALPPQENQPSVRPAETTRLSGRTPALRVRRRLLPGPRRCGRGQGDPQPGRRQGLLAPSVLWGRAAVREARGSAALGVPPGRPRAEQQHVVPALPAAAPLHGPGGSGRPRGAATPAAQRWGRGRRPPGPRARLRGRKARPAARLQAARAASGGLRSPASGCVKAAAVGAGGNGGAPSAAAQRRAHTGTRRSPERGRAAEALVEGRKPVKTWTRVGGGVPGASPPLRETPSRARGREGRGDVRGGRDARNALPHVLSSGPPRRLWASGLLLRPVTAGAPARVRPRAAGRQHEVPEESARRRR